MQKLVGLFPPVHLFQTPNCRFIFPTLVKDSESQRYKVSIDRSTLPSLLRGSWLDLVFVKGNRDNTLLYQCPQLLV